jgi:hypothetical protein
VEDQLLAERAITRSLQSYVNKGMPADASVLPLVRVKLSAPGQRARRRIRVWQTPIITTRRTIAIFVAAALFISAGLVAVATGSLTAPIRIHFTPFSNAQPSAVTGPCYKGATTTLSEAQKTVQYHVFTLEGYTPVPSMESATGVHFPPGCGPLAQPKTHDVGITYVIDGVPVQLNEGPAPDPNGSLTINLKWYATKVAPKIMDIDGSQYAVWPMHPTTNAACSAQDGVSLAAWQIDGTVLYLAPNYTSINQAAAKCSQGAIPFQTFLKIIHNVH